MKLVQGGKGKPEELQASEYHICARKDHGADLSGNYAKAHGKQKVRATSLEEEEEAEESEEEAEAEAEAEEEEEEEEEENL
ncbi:hypothetical protein HGM15179_008960 [Zosterops borbonicus]|uniref:Uncharacterized protein n=1 Tax=Zosterops borbonicus TaxID=364589 RepID=A0A8K1GG11_9PASS|nr:hypothetical protein HGM15179_008960 [Zosterops borbonicus]